MKNRVAKVFAKVSTRVDLKYVEAQGFIFRGVGFLEDYLGFDIIDSLARGKTENL